jgi:hypothetical protein
MTLADLLQGRIGRSGAADLAGMSGGAPVGQAYRDLDAPLRDFDGGLPGESQWFRSLPRARQRDFGLDWPVSPWQPVQPDPNTRGNSIDPFSPMYRDFWPWVPPARQSPGAPRPRGSA